MNINYKTINSTQKRVFGPRLELDRNVTVTRKEQFLGRIRDKLPEAVYNISVTPPSSHYVPESILEIENIVTKNPSFSPNERTAKFVEMLSFNDHLIIVKLLS